MKKLFLSIFLLSPLFLFGQFGWGNIASNQFVSALDAQGSGITQINQLPSSYRWLTKSDCIYYLNVDQSYLSGYDSNQWVQKQHIVSAAEPTSFAYRIDVIGWSTAGDACTNFDPNDAEAYDVVYSADATPDASSCFYTDAGLTNPHYIDYVDWYGLCKDNDLSTRWAVIGAQEGSCVTDIIECTNYQDMFDPTSAWVSSAAQSVTINVTADGSTYNLSCDDTWFTTSVSSVTGTTSFTINIDANTGDERISQVSVTLNGNWVVGIQIRQDAP